MKHARSCRVSSNIPAVLPLSKLGFFLHTFPINKGLILCTLSSGLGGLLTFYDHPLFFFIKVDQPENLFSLEVFFVYTSNLCQPQKVLNKVTFSWNKSAVGYNKKKNLLIAQRSDVVNTKATPCFSYIPTILTNALPGKQWIRDMGTWQQALAQQ